MLENLQMNLSAMTAIFGALIAVFGAAFFITFAVKASKSPEGMTKKKTLKLIGLYLIPVILCMVFFHYKLNAPYEMLDGEYAIELLSKDEFHEKAEQLTLTESKNDFINSFQMDFYKETEGSRDAYVKVTKLLSEESIGVFVHCYYSYLNGFAQFRYYKQLPMEVVDTYLEGETEVYLHVSSPDPKVGIELCVSWAKEEPRFATLTEAYDTYPLSGDPAMFGTDTEELLGYE